MVISEHQIVSASNQRNKHRQNRDFFATGARHLFESALRAAVSYDEGKKPTDALKKKKQKRQQKKKKKQIIHVWGPGTAFGLKSL